MKFLAIVSIQILLGVTAIASQVVQPSGINQAILLRNARSLEQQGKYKEAANLYLTLYRIAPQNITYYLGVRKNLLEIKDYQALASFINEARQQNSQDVRFRFEVDDGDLLFKRGQEKEALKKWDQIVQENRQNLAVYNLVTSAMIENRLFDEAVELYLLGREQLENPDLFVFELANLFSYRQEFRKSTGECLRYLKTNPDQYEFIDAKFAEFEQQEGAGRQIAEALLDALERETTLQNQLHYLLGSSYLRVRNYEAALRHYELIANQRNVNVPLDRDGKQLFKFAGVAIRDGAFEIGRRAFDLIITRYAASPYLMRARLGIAQSYESEGRFAEAVQAYKNLQMAFPTAPQAPEALYRIGNIFYTQFFDYPKAIDSFKFLIEKYPASSDRFNSMFRIGDCWLALGDLDKAMEWYQKPLNDKTAKAQDVVDEANYNVARIYYFRGDFTAALESLKTVGQGGVKNNLPVSVLLNDALTLSIRISDNQADAEVLKQFTAAELNILQRKYAEALTLFQALINQKPKSNLADQALLNVGDLFRSTGDFNAAMTAYSRLLADYTGSFIRDLAQQRLGEVLEHDLGDLVKAQKAYEKLLVDYPNSLLLEETRKRIRAIDDKSKQLVP